MSYIFSIPSKNIDDSVASITDLNFPPEICKEIELIRSGGGLGVFNFFGLLAGLKRLLVVVFLLQIFSKSLFLVSIYTAKFILDSFETNEPFHWLIVMFACALLAAAFINSLCLRYQSYVSLSLSLKFHRANLDVLEHGGRSLLDASDLAAKNRTLISSDIKQIQGFVNGFLSNFVPSILALSILLPVFYFELGYVGIFTGLMTLLIIPISAVLTSVIGKFQKLMQDREESLNHIVTSWINKIRDIRFQGKSEEYEQSISGELNEYLKSASKQHLFVVMNFSLTMTWMLAPLVFLVFMSAFNGINLSIGSIFASIWIVGLLSSTVQYIPFTLASYASARVCWKRIGKYFDSYENQFMAQTLASGSAKSVNCIEMQGIYLESTGKKHNIEFNLESQSLLIASQDVLDEVFEYLLGLRDLKKGVLNVIYSNGESEKMASFRNKPEINTQMAYAMSKPPFVSASIAENVALTEEYSEDLLMHALKVAELQQEFVNDPRLYKETLSEEGKDLSGGQSQRIGIARTVYSGRRFSIFNNSFSAIDMETQLKIVRNLSDAAYFIVID